MAQLHQASSELRTSRLLYFFCKLLHPTIDLPEASFHKHLVRCFELYNRKAEVTHSWTEFVEQLHTADWLLAIGCLEADRKAWEILFASRAGRADRLLVDALRARAQRLYPGNEERQDTAVTEFWSQLLVPESSGATPILTRYDGQRPLVPWLIRVFHNLHISQLRQRGGLKELGDDEFPVEGSHSPDTRWHEAFCLAAREALQGLKDQELLILGLRMRYRLSQREVASLLGVHEGTISRQTTALRDRVLSAVEHQLVAQGWLGDDLSGFVLRELGSVLLDEPRLSADCLRSLLHDRGRSLPVARDA